MKKILTVILAVCMIAAMSVTAFAAENKETEITYSSADNDGVDTAEWTVTVPATLTAGTAGKVTAEGRWAPSHILSVTADKKVALYIGGDVNADYATLPVTYNPIALAGSYAKPVIKTETVTVDAENLMSKIKFGAWSGTLTFTISLDADPDYKPGNVAGVSGVTGQEELDVLMPEGGDIEIASGKYTKVSALNTNNAINLTVHDGDFTEQIATPNTNDSNGVFSYFNRKDVITIEGGNFDGLYLAFMADDVTININGGTFNVSYWVYADSGVWTISITGGTFNLDPTPYLAEGYTADQGADNMWTVSAE